MTEPQNPEPAAAPPPSQPPVNWAATAAPPQPVPGTAGLVYADVPNRIFALIIDGIILAIVTTIINGVLYGIVGQPITIGTNLEVGFNILPLLIGAIVSLAISALYFTYLWSSMRASIGQRLLGMQVGNFPDGQTLTQAQAFRRWAILYVPFSIGQVAYVAPLLGGLIGLLTLGYAIYLLWTTAQSPTKRGFHDIFANTVVVKAARTV